MPRGVDHDGMRLVTGMLRLDPESRMTVRQCLLQDQGKGV